MRERMFPGWVKIVLLFGAVLLVIQVVLFFLEPHATR
jgi:hypothetical protein